MRLDKFLSDSTAYTRSEIKALIKQGRVSADGIGAVSAQSGINENTAVFVDGVRIIYKKNIYLIMNKPAGYVSAVYDKHDPTVCELIPEEFMHFSPFPAGRLDIDTEGLLILTNDGKFAHDVTSPKKDVYKRYYAECDNLFTEADAAVFAAGMNLGDFFTRPARLEVCGDGTRAYIEICEGKFHQVKRMCAYVGKTVKYLKRVAIGDLILPPELQKGECAELTYEQIKKLIGI